MPIPSRFWADLKTTDFAALDPVSTVAVLPVAATEQHGPHLPLSVDQTLVDGVIAAALPQLDSALPVLFLPTQQIGYSPEHIQFPGTLTLSSATLAATWIELGECVARAGLKKLLLLNSHGGQASVMDIVARELRTRCNLIVYSCSWWNLP
ncbi:MAG: creatininase family protein, partial [Ramlibacter sp.]